MDEQIHAKCRQLVHLEHGMVLVTGPTGSGKGTTLYAALRELNTKDRNVLPLEDPIEYQLDGISQTQINTKKGMTFAAGLRSILRQAPDVIMLGEIRDNETAVMAIQSALTGHLVFSTLHTNDAASAVTRLLDLGIEPYLLASSVMAVLAQRLVRRNCFACSVPHSFAPEELLGLGMEAIQLGSTQMKKGQGCPECRNTGYRGRLGIFELLPVSDRIREEIQVRSNATQIRALAVAEGMRLLVDDGRDKVLVGRTTPSEIRRATM